MNMEDYSVGSLSDLITGSVTPNKKKVIKVKKEIVSKTFTVPMDIEQGSELSEFRPKKKAKKPKLVKKENTSFGGSSGGNLIRLPKKQEVSESDESAEKPKKAAKKRRLAEGGESEPTQKKSKNAKNAEKRVAAKDKAPKEEEDPERIARTVFVGNLPITLTSQKFKRLFAKYGKVDTVRIRGAPVDDPKTPKKVAIIKKKFHRDRKSFYGFVRYEEREGAVKAAAEANGLVFQEHHLIVHLCDVKDKPDENKAIFVGNLSFHAEEEDLWKTFESCGGIESVRIVRDGRTGMGKGFGYVNFVNPDSVTLALEMENVKVKERVLRISVCNNNAGKKIRNKDKVKKITYNKPGKPRSPKKEQGEDAQENGVKAGNKSFQGVKFVQKKKKKFNKGLLEKKKKIKQLAPK